MLVLVPSLNVCYLGYDIVLNPVLMCCRAGLAPRSCWRWMSWLTAVSPHKSSIWCRWSSRSFSETSSPCCPKRWVPESLSPLSVHNWVLQGSLVVDIVLMYNMWQRQGFLSSPNSVAGILQSNKHHSRVSVFPPHHNWQYKQPRSATVTITSHEGRSQNSLNPSYLV